MTNRVETVFEMRGPGGSKRPIEFRLYQVDPHDLADVAEVLGGKAMRAGIEEAKRRAEPGDVVRCNYHVGPPSTDEVMTILARLRNITSMAAAGAVRVTVSPVERARLAAMADALGEIVTGMRDALDAAEVEA